MLPDLLIVLGAGKRESMRRASYAAELGNDWSNRFHWNGQFLVTGDCSDKINIEKMKRSEAEYMSLVLNLKGISSERIHLDTIAKNTWENFYLNRTLIEAMNPKCLGVVTGKVHSKRAMNYAEKIYGGKEIISYPVPVKDIWDVGIETITFGCEVMSKFVDYAKGSRR